MLRLFTGYNAETNFAKPSEFTAIRNHIKKLRDKQTELTKEAKSLGADSLAYRKQAIIDQLLTNIDNAINTFNNENLSDETNRNTQMLSLVKQLEDIVYKFGMTFTGTLNTHRKTHITSINNMTRQFSYLTAAVATVYISPTLLGGLLGIYVLGPKGEKFANKNLALKTNLTASMQIIDDLHSALIKLGENLGLGVSWHTNIKRDYAGAVTIPEAFYCPISGQIIKHPVICSLDQITYEHESITKWLTENRTSPINRGKMEKDAKLEDVLIRNEALERLIGEFRMANPQLIDQEQHETDVALKQLTRPKK